MGGEETGVRRGGGRDAPAEFLWRGQLHRVRAVLDHRRARVVPPAPSGDRDATAGTVAQPGGARPGSSAEPDQDPGRDPGADHETWRVRAAVGRAGRPGVFDLRFDWNDGRWTVIRIDTLEGDL